ncbi:sulfurtransferase TusA family protein [Oceanotoga sp. DSM 15011]|uniref:sulfurtransferase TusA family protein n=1 Tax=Oceanotoga sp. DSM 15011 TaxID=2984951 RepID=UPI0021F42702|nr:sulfurtransferase TusA family protein [Oceanotoga sp. DSM 15011]UYP01140.1 sulfurtransferase TusA family protein [Oceanotoga sp. DSM 15011]
MKIFDSRLQSLDLPTLFKILSNQSRLEILILLKEQCFTATEISKQLDMDISTVYRHLKYLKNYGLIRSFQLENTERYDLASKYLYELIEAAISALSGIKGTRAFSSGMVKIYSSSIEEIKSIKPDKVLDVRGEMCPVPDIQCRNTLREMNPEEILVVVVDYPLSKERIPDNIRSEGHELLAVDEDKLGDTRIYIRRR